MVDSVLFCPFCRESFEGETSCPEHELALVPFQKLPAAPHEHDEYGDWDELDDEHGGPAEDGRSRDEPELPLFSPSHGRGAIALGAIATGIAFATLPFTAATLGHEQSVVTGAQLANHRATNLWTIAMVVLAQLGVLFVRRTPRSLVGARLVWPILSVVGCASLGHTLSRIAAGTPSAVALSPLAVAEYGVWVMFGSLLFTALAGLRAGR